MSRIEDIIYKSMYGVQNQIDHIYKQYYGVNSRSMNIERQLLRGGYNPPRYTREGWPIDERELYRPPFMPNPKPFTPKKPKPDGLTSTPQKDTVEPVSTEASKSQKETAMKNFELHENASRRTKQRYRAHEEGRCSDKCRFCRRAGSEGSVKMTFVPSDPNQAEGRLLRKPAKRKFKVVEPLPTAKGVLAGAVANNYHVAAKKVSAKKAEVEINQAAFIPGMKVYHQFNNHPCILLEETQPGFWSIQMEDGNTEQEVPAAILTPIKPPFTTRSWMWMAKTLKAIYYYQTDVKTDTGLIEQDKVRKLPVFFTTLLILTLGASLPVIL